MATACFSLVAVHSMESAGGEEAARTGVLSCLVPAPCLPGFQTLLP